MKSLIYLLAFGSALFFHSTNEIKQQLALDRQNIIIAKDILVDFLTEYVVKDEIYISFIVPREKSTIFQRELLDAVFGEPALPTSTYDVLNELDAGKHRKKTFNVIFVKDRETLE